MSHKWVYNFLTLCSLVDGRPPKNFSPTYPTALVSASQEAQVAAALRTLLDNNGFSAVKIVGCVFFSLMYSIGCFFFLIIFDSYRYEHNCKNVASLLISFHLCKSRFQGT